MEEQPVPEGQQLGLGHLLDLVGGVPGLDLGTQRPPLDGLGQDGGRRTHVLGGRLVGGIQLAVVVPAPGQGLQVLVGEVGHQRLQAGIGSEEVLPDVGPRLGGVLLELTVDGGVHLVEKDAFDVLGQQVVPRPAPDDLDDVPSGAPEEGLELLDDLAVAPNGTVEPLEIAVDDEYQVVQVLPSGHAQGPDGLGLVELPVPHESPHPAGRGVGQAAGMEVPAHVGLGDGVEGTETHGHRRVLPELGHQPRVGVGGQPGHPHLEPEIVEVHLAQPTFDEGPGVDAGRGMALEVHLVPGRPVVLAPEEVVEPHLVERGRTGVGGQVAADGLGPDVGPHHHHRGVPPDVGPDPSLEVLVAREVGLLVGGDGVDVGRGHRGREVHVLLTGPLQDTHQQIAGPGPPVDIDDVVEGVQPLAGLGGVSIGKLMAHSVEQHDPMLPLTGRQGKSTAGRRSSGRVGPVPIGHAVPMHAPSTAPRRADRGLHRRLLPGEPRARGMGLGGGRRAVGQRGRGPHHQSADGGDRSGAGPRGPARAGARGERLDLRGQLLPQRVVGRLEASGLAQHAKASPWPTRTSGRSCWPWPSTPVAR